MDWLTNAPKQADWLLDMTSLERKGNYCALALCCAYKSMNLRVILLALQLTVKKRRHSFDIFVYEEEICGFQKCGDGVLPNYFYQPYAALI